MANTFVNISNSFSINELLRGYEMKIYCEDSYGSMVELTSIISEDKDSRKLDLRYLQYLLGGAFFEGCFGRAKIPDDINHIMIRLNTLYQAGSISDRKAIEILSNAIMSNKQFKVLLYFKNYDETLNPFCGFELFNSFEELQEVVKRLPRYKYCKTNEELNEMLKSYSSNSNSEKENRYNNIIKLLIILCCCSRTTEW
jgi:hypothetical protein